MIEITIQHLLLTITFLGGSCMSLVLYIYNSQTRRITKMEQIQKDCPINKIYTILERAQTDITWIKQSIQKKN